MKQVPRTFIPGDEWLFYKIYTGPKTSETILRDVLLPISEKLLKENCITKWFFIRYNDPEYHLRIRFHCTNLREIDMIIHEFRLHLNIFIQNDLIYRVQLDTYQRELERYGKTTIGFFEQLFFIESEIILKFLMNIHQKNYKDDRWFFGAMYIDKILTMFGYDLSNKCSLFTELKDSFGKEFGLDRALRKQLNSKYLNNRYLFEYFILDKNNIPTEIKLFESLLNANLLRSTKIIDSIIINTEKEKLKSRIQSCLHMFLNRLFRSKNRLQEFVLYYMLFKHYQAELNYLKFKDQSLN